MSTDQRGVGRSTAPLSRQLSRAGHGLLAVFAITAVFAALPLRLGQPAWQIQISAALINNGSIALVGMLLIALASWLAPSEPLLVRRNRLVQRLAIGAVVGYLLLIPLQATALWQGMRQAGQLAARQQRGAEERLAAVESAVVNARSAANLQARLRRIPGAPPLASSQLIEPMAVIRQRFRLALDQARGRLRSTLAEPGPDQVQRLLLESIRIGLSSLALAFAFAAGAQGKGNRNASLLDGWLEAAAARRRRRR